MRVRENFALSIFNPLNIRYNINTIWQGQKGNERGFVRFNRYSMCYRAAVKILRSYHLRDIRSIRDIIKTWAPEAENDTGTYIKNVVNFMNGCWRIDTGEPDYCARTQINLRDRQEVVNLLMAMTRQECGANTAQLQELKGSIMVGYDLAVTDPKFFLGIAPEEDLRWK